MAHRDPETGQFVSGGASGNYEDYEQVTFSANATVLAADLDGSASGYFGQNGGFAGLQILDYDEVVDRNEELELLHAEHRGYGFIKSTSTSDGTVRAVVEVSASPSGSQALQGVGASGSVEGGGDFAGAVQGASDAEDSIDVVGRPLELVGFAPFSDGASGVGGGGSSSGDTAEIDGLPKPISEFHPRDELFLNGYVEVSNVADAALHVVVTGQHLYGVST